MMLSEDEDSESEISEFDVLMRQMIWRRGTGACMLITVA